MDDQGPGILDLFRFALTVFIGSSPALESRGSRATVRSSGLSIEVGTICLFISAGDGTRESLQALFRLHGQISPGDVRGFRTRDETPPLLAILNAPSGRDAVGGLFAAPRPIARSGIKFRIVGPGGRVDLMPGSRGSLDNP